MCMCASCSVCSQCAYSGNRGQKRVLESLELGLYMVISHLTWVLGTELSSSNLHKVFTNRGLSQVQIHGVYYVPYPSPIPASGGSLPGRPSWDGLHNN